jgi:hypothetical protein
MMRSGHKTILRLSGKVPDPTLEKKSQNQEAAAIFRRFFYALERLDLKSRFRLNKSPHQEQSR